MGANCIVIKQELVVSQCPLPKGVCFFRHRETGFCKYTETDGMSVNQLADLVGTPRITEAEYQSIQTNIRAKMENL